MAEQKAQSGVVGEKQVRNLPSYAQSGDKADFQRQAGTVATFRLLDLPPELRLRIYEYAVTSDGPVQITFNNYKPQNEYGIMGPEAAALNEWQQPAAIAERTQAALSRTCREIHVDALKLYYAHNDFEAGYCHVAHREFPTLVKWLDSFGVQHRERLRSLRISDVHTAYGGRDGCMEDPVSASLLRLGAVVEAVDQRLAVHMVTFPKAVAKE
ncbi:hypothetical protein LTR85_012093 [Meristemomyces frigidus]|nr:hypothetical protein LTR85_012093 [Meristemomyces frigidus]